MTEIAMCPLLEFSIYLRHFRPLTRKFQDHRQGAAYDYMTSARHQLMFRLAKKCLAPPPHRINTTTNAPDESTSSRGPTYRLAIIWKSGI